MDDFSNARSVRSRHGRLNQRPRFSRRAFWGVLPIVFLGLYFSGPGVLHSTARAAESPVGALELKIDGGSWALDRSSAREGQFFHVRVRRDASSLSKATSGILMVRFLGQEISLQPTNGTGLEAFVAVPVDSSLGDKKIELVSALAGSDSKRILGSFLVTVLSGEFPAETLNVQPRKVKPLARDLPKIQRDQRLIRAAYQSPLPDAQWEGPWKAPLESVITSVFGSKRVYNGVKQSAHLGTDFRAPVGTPIVAPARGRVVLAKNLFFTGNTVILDHGMGFFTIYGHLSKIRVKELNWVLPGQLVGLAGATGRASGPHLHWGMNLHGVKVDPVFAQGVLR